MKLTVEMEQKSIVDELTDILRRLSDEDSGCEVSYFIDALLLSQRLLFLMFHVD